MVERVCGAAAPLASLDLHDGRGAWAVHFGVRIASCPHFRNEKKTHFRIKQMYFPREQPFIFVAKSAFSE